MRFILVKCAVADDRFPDHVQWRATCGNRADHFFWIRREDGIIGAKVFILNRYPNATFTDE